MKGHVPRVVMASGLVVAVVVAVIAVVANANSAHDSIEVEMAPTPENVDTAPTSVVAETAPVSADAVPAPLDAEMDTLWPGQPWHGDMAPEPVFMATQPGYVSWHDPRTNLVFGGDCSRVDRWDGTRWEEYIAAGFDTDGWVAADRARDIIRSYGESIGSDGEPGIRACELGGTLGLSFDMPSEAEVGIYRWCDSECYVFEYRPASFNAMFDVLTRWSEATGDAWVPRHVVFEGERLGLWAESMRLRHGGLHAERIERLESLAGWAWTFHRPADQRQDLAPEPTFMATLRDWERDDLRSSQSPGSECARLDEWVGDKWLQILVRIGAEGWVAADTVAADATSGTCALGESDTIGALMPEESRNRIYRWCTLAYEECHVFEYFDRSYNRMTKSLQQWIEETGLADVPIDTEYQGQRLGLWVDAMHYEYEQGTLTPNRIAKLEATPGWEWR